MPEIANYDEALARERKTLPRRQWWQWWARYNDEREARLRALANVVHGQGMYLTTFYRLFEAHERRCEERHKEVLERIDAHLNAHEAGR
jgi:hypothetical protein